MQFDNLTPEEANYIVTLLGNQPIHSGASQLWLKLRAQLEEQSRAKPREAAEEEPEKREEPEKPENKNGRFPAKSRI